MAIKENKKTKKPAAKKGHPPKKQKLHSSEQASSFVVLEPPMYHASNSLMNPAPMYNAAKSRIRAIGNSKGVILNNQLLKDAGIDSDADIIAYADDGRIIIMQAKETGINTDISTWDAQFKSAKKKGHKPEKDLFVGLANSFDAKEW